MAIKHVALLGASGQLGPFILRALLESKLFAVTILKRAESKTMFDEYPDVKVLQLPANYWEKTAEVAKILTGQDALVVALPGARTTEPLALATACCMAKVQRMIPADFGSVDSSDQVCIDLVPLYGKKQRVREVLQGLSLSYPTFSWSSLICGHFLDFGLATPLLGFDVSSSPPSAIIFDGGNIKWSASNRSRIGTAVVNLLSPEFYEETRNKLIYIQSVNVNQNEVLALFEKVSGTKWDVRLTKSQEYIDQKKKEMEDLSNHNAEEEMVGVLGVTRANWETKETFYNKLFGFEPESVEESVRKAWETRKSQ